MRPMRTDFGEMLDTSPAARARYYELLRSLTPAQRASRAASLSRTVRAAAVAEIARTHPNADETELRARLVERMYGPGIAARFRL